MKKCIYTWFKFNECTKVCHSCNFTCNNCSYCIFFFSISVYSFISYLKDRRRQKLTFNDKRSMRRK